jgi:hypothetical protein
MRNSALHTASATGFAGRVRPIGAGYIGGDWPSENYDRRNGNTGYLDYGQIADITVTQ